MKGRDINHKIVRGWEERKSRIERELVKGVKRNKNQQRERGGKNEERGERSTIIISMAVSYRKLVGWDESGD